MVGVNLTTQRKVAMALLGTALVALVLDRTVLAPGGASAATPSPAASHPTVAATAPSGVTPAASPSGRSENRSRAAGISSRLSIALDSPKWTADQVVGSLRPSPEWTAPAGEPGAPASDRAGKFKASHQLRAVMSRRDAESRIALIDGRPMRVGEVLEGYTLVAVGARSAVFESGADRIVLSLPGTPEQEPGTDR